MQPRHRTGAQDERPPSGVTPLAHLKDRVGPLGRFGWFPLTVTLVYALIGALWILLSDRIVAQVSPDVEALQVLQTYKGWFFVAVTAFLLFIALSAAERHVTREREQRETALTRLDLALQAAQGGIWERNFKTGHLYVSPHVKRLLGLSPDTHLDLEAWRARIHPEDLASVRMRMREFQRCGRDELSLCYRLRNADGDYCWFQIVGRNVGVDQDRRLLGVMIDVTDLRRAEASIERLVHYDALTGLPNRHFFQSEFARRLEGLAEGHGIVLARCDLDGFGEVNTEFGPEEGDKVLHEVAGRLHDFVGSDGFCGRIGGDEFAVFMPAELGSLTSVRAIAERLEQTIRAPITLKDANLELNASIGIALAPQDGSDTNLLMANADVAVGEARRQGRGQTRFYASGMNEALRRRRSLGRELRKALDAQLLEPYYQPIVALPGRELVGFEALVRWHHPERGAISPAEFVPMAEELGLIGEIGDFMLHRACRDTHAWQEATGNGFRVAVNLSSIDLERTDLAQSIASILDASGLAPDRLELEVTETAVMRDIDLAVATLSSLRALGVSIAIDDFGTGYSSLVALRRLPVSELKIDRSFVDGYGSDPEDTAIVNSIIELAHSLGLALTAEGVETEEQCARLCDRGCEHAQGFLFSPPVPPTRVWRLIAGDEGPTNESGQRAFVTKPHRRAAGR